jgi:hypothetical protein
VFSWLFLLTVFNQSYSDHFYVLMNLFLAYHKSKLSMELSPLSNQGYLVSDSVEIITGARRQDPIWYRMSWYRPPIYFRLFSYFWHILLGKYMVTLTERFSDTSGSIDWCTGTCTMKLPGQMDPNYGEMVFRWSPFRIISDNPAHQRRWWPFLKIEDSQKFT